MHYNNLLWAFALLTRQAIAGAVHPAAETATLVQRQDSCKDYVSKELAMPTPAPGLQSVRACSVRFSNQSTSSAYDEYHASVAQYFNRLESKLSSLSSATSCDEPFTTTYSNICTGNITAEYVVTSTGSFWTAIGTVAVTRSALKVPTGKVVIDWAKVSKTSAQPTASPTGGDDTSGGPSRFNARLGVALGLTVAGCLWAGL